MRSATRVPRPAVGDPPCGRRGWRPAGGGRSVGGRRPAPTTVRALYAAGRLFWRARVGDARAPPNPQPLSPPSLLSGVLSSPPLPLVPRTLRQHTDTEMHIREALTHAQALSRRRSTRLLQLAPLTHTCPPGRLPPGASLVLAPRPAPLSPLNAARGRRRARRAGRPPPPRRLWRCRHRARAARQRFRGADVREKRVEVVVACLAAARAGAHPLLSSGTRPWWMLASDQGARGARCTVWTCRGKARRRRARPPARLAPWPPTRTSPWPRSTGWRSVGGWARVRGLGGGVV